MYARSVPRRWVNLVVDINRNGLVVRLLLRGKLFVNSVHGLPWFRLCGRLTFGCCVETLWHTYNTPRSNQFVHLLQHLFHSQAHLVALLVHGRNLGLGRV